MNIKNFFAAGAITTTLLVGCGSPAILLSAEVNTLATSQKTSALSDAQLQHWGHSDLVTDTIPGMSVQKAYDDIFNTITELQPTTVIVGVLDSGVDIEHEELKNVFWTNEGEIPGTEIDDGKKCLV